jgi:hypothetical protein
MPCSNSAPTRTEHCDLECRAPAFRLPDFRFRVYRIETSTRAATFSWPGSDARDDLSLACNGCGFHRLHSRVNVPGLPLRFPADRFHCPFHLRLRYRPTIRSAIGRLNTLDALQLPRPTDLPLLRPPLPFRTVTSLRIKAFCRTCCKPTRLPISPDFRSLPAAGFYH